jgi:hypothetical protein
LSPNNICFAKRIKIEKSQSLLEEEDVSVKEAAYHPGRLIFSGVN